MSSFAWILAVRDAPGPDSVTNEKHLSTELITKARKEILAVQNERARKIRNKYFAKRKKLTTILSESHLIAADVRFDPNKEVEEKNYLSEKQNIKAYIKSAKALLADRKEMVLRIELV
nr:uncharacterized protein LOC120966260 [Aegilops tauschii subsp. strangulata]